MSRGYSLHVSILFSFIHLFPLNGGWLRPAVTRPVLSLVENSALIEIRSVDSDAFKYSNTLRAFDLSLFLCDNPHNFGSNGKYMEACNGANSSSGFRKSPKTGIQPA